jgi:hypothetical protein
MHDHGAGLGFLKGRNVSSVVEEADLVGAGGLQRSDTLE